MAIGAEPLGDTANGIAVRVTFRYAVPGEVPAGIPLVISGSVTQQGVVVRRFRYPVDARPDSYSAVLVLAPGAAEIEARLMVPLEEESPVLVAKGEAAVTVAKTNRDYVPAADAAADAIVAGGVVPEQRGAVKIVPPRRDVSPRLFIVDVETNPPVRRVEFWVEGKKIITRNAPPYRAELDLGDLPKRVEVRAVGYDAKGNYVDADAFVVNEHETPLEAKITRTDTPDGIAHFKVSVQNPKGTAIRSAALFAGDRKLVAWSGPPYALDIPIARLAGVELPVVPPPRFAPMSWDEARALEGAGVSFGPHTVTHPILSSAPDAQATLEITESWRRLAAEVAHPVPVFCYPNGRSSDFGSRETEVLRRLGLCGAVTGEPAPVDPAAFRRSAAARFAVPRYGFRDDLPFLLQSVCGLEALKARLRRS